METYRKSWNKQQTVFRDLLLSGREHEQAIAMFFSQHALLHAAQMPQTAPWSFPDWVLHGMTEAQIRCIPPNGEHSVVWLLWHMALKTRP